MTIMKRIVVLATALAIAFTPFVEASAQTITLQETL